MRLLFKALIIILLVVLIVIGIQVYGYSSLKTDFSVTGLSPQFDVSVGSVAQSLITAFSGNILSAASTLIQGVNIEGSLIIKNNSIVPIYLPTMQHKILLNGIQSRNQIQTNSMWLTSNASKTVPFKLLIDKTGLSSAVLSLLASGGNIDISIDSSTFICGFTITKSSEKEASVTKALSSYLTSSSINNPSIASYSFAPNPITLGNSSKGSINITGGSSGTYTLVILKDISLGSDESVATYTMNHDGTTSNKTVSFAPNSSGNFYFHIEYNGSTIWSQPNDNSRLTVVAPITTTATTSLSITTYAFSPNPLTLGRSTIGSITITGGNTGTFTLVILKDISLGSDEAVATYTINHNGTTSSKTITFTPTSSGNYYFHIEYNGSMIWSQPNDNSRLTVVAPVTTTGRTFSVTSYGFDPNPISLGNSTSGNITITGGNPGTYTLVVLKDISFGSDQIITSYVINHDGTTSSKTVSINPNSRGSYYFHIEYNGNTIWSQPNNTTRLTVK